MKIQFKAAPSVILEAEAKTPAELFDQLAALCEAFTPKPCGLCNSTSITFVTRTDAENNKYRMHVCKNPSCGAEWRLGLRRGEGQILFPQLRDPKTNAVKPHGGWVIFGEPEQGNNHGNGHSHGSPGA
jgi:hypothetical protein